VSTPVALFSVVDSAVKQSSFPSFRTQTHRDQDNHKQAERHDDVLGGSLEAACDSAAPVRLKNIPA
jgi:hypothetical protein